MTAGVAPARLVAPAGPGEVLPVVLVRVPLLAVEEVCANPFGDLLGEHRRLAAERDLLSGTATSLAERVTRVVNTDDRVARRALLQLRRDLHNGRDVPCTAVDHLPASLREEVQRWQSHRRALDEAQQQHVTLWQAAEHEAHRALLRVLRHPPFLAALQLAHPALAERARGLPSDSTAWQRRDHRLARTLLLLVWRAALCPVPLGLYASTALGTWERSPVLADVRERVGRTTAGAQRLARFTAAALGRPAVLDRVELAVTGGVLGSTDAGPPASVLRATAGDLAVEQLPESARDLIGRCGASGVTTAAALLRQGVPAHDVVAAVRAGLLRVRWPGDALDQRRPDDRELTAAVWAAALEDPHLLPAIELVRPGDGRVGEAPGHVDSGCLLPVGLDVDAYAPVLNDLATAGVRLVEPQPSPERQAVARLLHACGGGEPTRLLALMTRLRALLAQVGAAPALLASPRATADALGIEVPDPVALQAIRQVDLTSTEVVLHPEVSWPGLAPDDVLRRACVRLVPVPARHGGAGARVTFWGGDRMSLLPRYAELPVPGVRDALEHYRRWLAAWPDLVDLDVGSPSIVDLRGRVTRRRLAGPEAGRCAGDLVLDDVVVLPRGDDVLLIDARDGTAIDPVYLGVIAAAHLPLPFRLLLALGPARRTAMDLAFDALNRSLAALCQTTADHAVVPAVWLTGTVQLLPPSVVVPARSLPTGAGPDPVAALLAVRRWMDERSLELAWVEVRRADVQAEPLLLDLLHPVGALRLLKLAAAGPQAVLLLSRASVGPGHGLSTTGGTMAAELVVELRA